MLKILIEKEIRDIVGSTTFAVIFGACAVLILICFYVGAQTYKSNLAQYEAAKAENLRQLEGLTDWFSVRQQRIFLPPQPLASLVSGVSYDIGRTMEVWGRGELAAIDSKFGDEPIYAIFRFLDLEFLFQVILSLFAILLGYDAISGEKERGTLKLSFASAVPRGKYILGKLLGSLLALSVPLTVALAVGCLLLPILGIPMNGSDWTKLLIILAAGLLYFSAFLILSIFISARTDRSSNSFLILLVVWILCVLIVPRASVQIAGRAVDVPSVDELAAQKAKFQQQQWQEDRAGWANFKPTGGTDDPEKAMDELNRFMNDQADAREKKSQEFNSRLNEQRYNKQREQQTLALNLARISPAASLSLSLTNLAGTSVDLKDHYADEAQNYQGVYGNFMKEKTGTNPGGRMMMFRMAVEDDKEKPEPINPQELPEFKYNAISTGRAVSAAMLDMGLLGLFNLIFFAGAFVSFLKYDVR